MIILNKNNIVKTLYREWATRLAPLHPPIDRLLLWVMQTGKYAPAAAWVITGQGSACRTFNSMLCGTLFWPLQSALLRTSIVCFSISADP